MVEEDLSCFTALQINTAKTLLLKMEDKRFKIGAQAYEWTFNRLHKLGHEVPFIDQVSILIFWHSKGRINLKEA